jgi:hypothetical protein
MKKLETVAWWIDIQVARRSPVRWYRRWRGCYWLHLPNHCVAYPKTPDYPAPHVKGLQRKWNCAFTMCQWFRSWTRKDVCIFLEFWILHSVHMKHDYILLKYTCLWASENPFGIHEDSFHSTKIGMWCAIFQTRIIGPLFFDCTMNTEVYLTIFTAFVSQLTDKDVTIGCFHQDRTRCHTSHTSVREIESFFGDQIISKALWPTRSYWAYWREGSTWTSLTALMTLKKICQEITAMPLQSIMSSCAWMLG